MLSASSQPVQKLNLSLSEVKHETISAAPVVKKVQTTDRAVNTDKGSVRSRDTATDLSMQSIYTDKEVEVMIEGHEKKIKREEEALRARLRVKICIFLKPNRNIKLNISLG
jgi:hypothetical protein